MAKQFETFAVEIRGLAPEKLSEMDRAKRFQAMKHYTNLKRRELIEWLKLHDLWQSVSRITRGTIFPVLFVDTNQYVADQIKQFPDVIKVHLTEKVGVVFPSWDEKDEGDDVMLLEVKHENTNG